MIQCPNCGGNLKFSPSAQSMNCEHCNSQFDPYQFDSKTTDAEERELYDVTVFTCPQCGGEILSTDHAAAGFCSYCGASTILYGRISKEHRPRYIVPFRKTKEDCKKAYKNWMGRAIFAPKELKDETCIESFRGIYMPYWSYEVVQEGMLSLPGEKQSRRGDYIITKHFSLTGEVESWYDGIYYDASSAFEDRISEHLAPFQIEERKNFTPAFLSGFYADIPDVSRQVYENDARGKVWDENLKRIRQTPQFASCQMKTTGAGVMIPEVKVRMVEETMFPVWFMSYRKKDRVIYAAVNGQTGKVVADLPIAPTKYVIASLLLAVPIFLLLNWILVLTPSFLTILIGLIGLLTLFLYGAESGQIVKRNSLEEDKGRNWANYQNEKNRQNDRNLQNRINSQNNKKYQNDKSSQNSKNSQNSRRAEKPKITGYFGALIAVIISVLLLVFHPVSDLYYYGGAICSLFAICLTIVSIIRAYNVLSTHRLPQFEKQGGDDRA